MAPGFYGGKVRYRSADNVLELWRRHAAEGIKEIYIRDELFTCVQKRNKEICERMIEEKLDLSWICSSRVGLTRDELALFKKAGCHYMKFGVENGDQEILDRMQKGVQLEQIRDTFRYCHEVGINTHAHFMLGCPGETQETIQKTVDLAKEIDPTTATFGVMTPYPGTPALRRDRREAPRDQREPDRPRAPPRGEPLHGRDPQAHRRRDPGAGEARPPRVLPPPGLHLGLGEAREGDRPPAPRQGRLERRDVRGEGR